MDTKINKKTVLMFVFGFIIISLFFSYNYFEKNTISGRMMVIKRLKISDIAGAIK